MKKEIIILLILFSIPSVFSAECDTDSDCPADTYIGDAFCDENNLFRVYRDHFCVESEVNYCSYTDSNVPFGLCEEETGYGLHIKNIIFSHIERFYIQDLMEFSIFLENNGNSKIKDLKVSVLIYGIGEYYSTVRFDLKRGERVTKRMTFDVSNLPEGIYFARIVVSNDNLKRVFHRVIIID